MNKVDSENFNLDVECLKNNIFSTFFHVTISDLWVVMLRCVVWVIKNFPRWRHMGYGNLLLTINTRITIASKVLGQLMQRRFFFSNKQLYDKECSNLNTPRLRFTHYFNFFPLWSDTLPPLFLTKIGNPQFSGSQIFQSRYCPTNVKKFIKL